MSTDSTQSGWSRAELAVRVGISRRTRFLAQANQASSRLDAVIAGLRALYSADLQVAKTRMPERAADVDSVFTELGNAETFASLGQGDNALAAIEGIKRNAASIVNQCKKRKQDLFDELLSLANLITDRDSSSSDAEVEFEKAECYCDVASVYLSNDAKPYREVEQAIQKAREARFDAYRHLGGALPQDMKRKERKRHRKSLEEGLFLPDAPTSDDWANGVIELFDIENDKDRHSLDIHLKLSPHEYQKYFSLQNQMASKIKPENWRPTIWVTVKGNAAPAKSFGIIGGTGPLSDAEMLVKTMANLEKAAAAAETDAKLNGSKPEFTLEQVYIRVLSAPPPREGDKPTDDGRPGKGRFLQPKYDLKFARYLARGARFSRMDHHSMSLASNTAHSNLGSAQGARKWLNRSKLSRTTDENQVQDLAGRVVQKVLETPDAKPLILGTIAAYNNQMYAGFFAERSNGETTTAEVTQEEAEQLQIWIDRAKSGDLGDDLKRTLQDEVIKQMKQHKSGSKYPTHIILGCTELPLGLGGHDGIHELEKRLKKEGFDGVEIIDTEDFFANQYTNLVLSGAGAASPANFEWLKQPKTGVEGNLCAYYALYHYEDGATNRDEFMEKARKYYKVVANADEVTASQLVRDGNDPSLLGQFGLTNVGVAGWQRDVVIVADVTAGHFYAVRKIGGAWWSYDSFNNPSPKSLGAGVPNVSGQVWAKPSN